MTLEQRLPLLHPRIWLLGAAALLAAAQATYAQSSILGTNLIVNGNAEAGPAGTGITNLVTSIPGWTRGAGSANVLSYNTQGLIPSTAPAPPDHGFQYFAAGSAGADTLTQTIDVSSVASTIAGGNVKFSLSAYLGTANGLGLANPATVAAAFKNANGQTFSTATIGPIGFNGNGLSLQQQIGLVPAGTVQIGITLTLNYGCENAAACGYAAADSLSLVLTTLGTQPGPLLGTNLVVNGNAETGSGVLPPALTAFVPAWSTYGASVAPYGGTNWITKTDPSPVDAGVNLFCGGGSGANMYQDIDVSAAATLIDTSQITYQISAWLGGTAQVTSPTLTYTFFDWTGKQLATIGQLGPESHAGTSMVEASNADTLPAGTRRIHIVLTFPSSASLADDISFILSAPSGPPVIDPEGIVSASAFGGGTTLSQGGWIEIYGRNLGPARAVSWGGANFTNGVGPTSLGGVSVTIGGEPAYVAYASAGQVNVLLPSDAMMGPAPMIVTNADGSTDPYYVQVNSTLPSLLAPATFKISGKQYVAAFNTDGSFALPANAIVGVASAPAAVGETVVMYGVGFGAVSDGVTAGTLPTAQDSLILPLVVDLGTTKAQLAYAGLAAGLTGIYQINVVIPQLAASAAEPIALTLGAAKGSQTLYIAVQ